MNVTQISIGRFHHFHLARQLEKHGLLKKIYTGYPKFKLKDENGIPKNKIETFPWLHAAYMKKSWLKLDNWNWLNREWTWLDHETLDKYVANQIKEPTTLVALSSCGLNAAKKVKKTGGKFICDRGSSHVCYQNEILKEEYARWGLKFTGIDPRIIEKEETEYDLADMITVPSEFARQSFIKKGVKIDKIAKISYGARLDRFKKTIDPAKNKFRVLWVGGISIQKGFLYALEAFQRIQHPNKEFIVVGSISVEINHLLASKNLNNVVFKGNLPNSLLVDFYSSSHVFVLSSLQEGLAMVQGEAMACGCPVIASTNTGAQDLFTNGVEGFIVPIRSVDAIVQKMQELADNETLRRQMSEAAIKKIQSFGGWDQYGEAFSDLIKFI